MEAHPSCKQQWRKYKTSCVKQLKRILSGKSKDYEYIEEFGLCFDYVSGNKNQRGFWRYQIATGGPGYEFRFYANGPKENLEKITFAFLDWFDGYERRLSGKDYEILEQVWNAFKECGVVEKEYNQVF